jgi:hypothetical protein
MKQLIDPVFSLPGAATFSVTLETDISIPLLLTILQPLMVNFKLIKGALTVG